MLLHMDVSRCNLKIELFISRFQFLDLYITPPVSLVPSVFLGLWIQHNIVNFQQCFGVFFDYFHPLIQLVLFLIATNCFTHIWVVSRGMERPRILCVFCVGNNVVLRLHILSSKVGPCLFHSPTSVI